jgi:hypothetical protein
MISAGSLRDPPSSGHPKDGPRGVAASSPLHRTVARVMTSVQRRSKSIHLAVARAMISTSSRSRQPPVGFPSGTFDLELHPRPPLLAVARAKIRARPLPHSFPCGRLDRARPHAVAHARNPHAVARARIRTRSLPRSCLRGRFDRVRSSRSCPRKETHAVACARNLTQSPVQGTSRGCPRKEPRAVARARIRTRSSCAPASSRSCPRKVSDAPDPLAVTYGGFERLETGLAVARGMISSSGHSLVRHLAVARSMICVRVAERLR